MAGRDEREQIFLAEESVMSRPSFSEQVAGMIEGETSGASVLITSAQSALAEELHDTTVRLFRAVDSLMSPDTHLRLLSDAIPPESVEPHDSEHAHHLASLLFLSVREEEREHTFGPLIDRWKERKSKMITIEAELRSALQAFCERHQHLLSDGGIEWHLDQIMADASRWESLETSLSRVSEHLRHLEQEEEQNPGTPVLFQEICSWIDHRYRHEMSLSEVAEMFRVSTSYLSKLFRRHLDTSFTEYLTSRRIEAAKQIISHHPELPFKDVCLQVGYGDPFYFSRVFKQVEGIPPKEFANRIMEQETSDEKDKT